MGAKRVLFLVSSHDKFPDGEPTGLWAEELIAPFYVFHHEGYHIDIVSVKGGTIPIDSTSLKEENVTEDVKKFLGDVSLKALLDNTVAVKDVKESYDAVFVPGGHGVAFDVPVDKDSIALLEKFWAEGKVVAAVCHGPCAIVNVKTPSGEPIVKGRNVGGFTDSEEEAVGKTNQVPFLLETVLKERGANFGRAPDFQPYAVADGKLVTGQNPASAEKVAQLVVEALA